MRHLAVGDVHGCCRALTALAAFVPFRDDDVLVALGDYVDRGPDSSAVVDWLIDRKSRGPLVALRGNHEVMMLAAREGDAEFGRWLAVGGDAALRSYSRLGTAGRLADVPGSHWQFFEETLPYWETTTHFFVHAGAYPWLPLEDQPDLYLYWELFAPAVPHESGKTMICGHTRQRSGLPRDAGHAVCIDTGAHHEGGWLTCLDVESGEYWQADERGRVRKGRLAEA